MSVTAVDASAVAAVLFMEPGGESLQERLSGALVAPFLLPFEIANVCRQKMQRQPRLAQTWLERYRLLPRLNISFVAVDFETLPEVALRHGLSAYDAAYLQLALAHKAPLVTLDTRLADAWKQASAVKKGT